MGNFNRGNRSGGGRGFERRGFNDRGSRGPAQMHQAVCDNCRKNCEVPFRPTSGKPIFCSNCFEGKKEGGSRNREQFQSQPQYKTSLPSADGKTSLLFHNKDQFEVLNNKLDRILAMLIPNAVDKVEETVNAEETSKDKKSPSKSNL